ncbi:MAG: hypothetical protein K2X27_22050, partial [Candidatus Obscuribacterales bacterium]|nr:hypothetical protein [Candidatus Obscuribacterales bacterium]
YGDYLRKSNGKLAMLPSADEVSPGKFFNDSEEGFDSRIIQSTYSRPAESKSYFNDGPLDRGRDLSNSAGVQSGDYRLFLVLGFEHNQNKSSKSNFEEDSKTDLRIEFNGQTGSQLDLNASKDSNTKSASFKLAPEILKGSHLRIKVNGNASSAEDAEFSFAGVIDQKNRFIASVIPGTPIVFKVNNETKKFTFETSLPTPGLETGEAELRLEFRSLKGKCRLNDLKLGLEALQKPQFKNHSIKVF